MVVEIISWSVCDQGGVQTNNALIEVGVWLQIWLMPTALPGLARGNVCITECFAEV